MIAWSYSSLTAFETCARQFHIVKVLKLIREPETESNIWGNAVHKALELRVKDGTPLPATMAKYEPYAERIASSKGEVHTEMKIGLDANMKRCGFFDSGVRFRAIIDLALDFGDKAAVFDWKTGKVKKDHDQLNLFAATYMTIAPKIDTTRSGYIWLAYDKLTRKDVHREDVPVIWNGFNGRVQRLEIAHDKDKWIPKPSGLCNGWCPVGKEHCEFWSPKKQR